VQARTWCWTLGRPRQAFLVARAYVDKPLNFATALLLLLCLLSPCRQGCRCHNFKQG
jgi:hypothetical protein